MRLGPRRHYFALGLWLLLSPIQGAPTRAEIVPPARDFAEFLAACDLVVEGTVLGADSVERAWLETCGTTGLGPYRVTDLRVKVTRVWYGTADDSTLLISDLSRPVFALGPVAPGTKVIAWGFHNCHDGWRLWGSFCVVTTTGKILGPAGSDPMAFRLLGGGDSEPATYADLASALTNRPGLRGSQTLFEGASGVALLRLVHTTPRGPEGFTYECDSVGWVLGPAGHVPRYIDFPRVPGCYPEIFAGASLIVPIPIGFSGDRLSVDGCPRSFLVRKNFAVAFGVPVSLLDRALRSDGGQLHVSSFIVKE